MSAVLLVHDDAPHAFALRQTLESLDFRIAAAISGSVPLKSEVVRLAPDLIVICTRSPARALLDGVRAVTESHPRPVVMFANDVCRDTIREAVDAGVSAYVVDGWAPERVAPIIHAACARFDAHQAIKRELATTRMKLSERKLIEKAKGIVMQQRGVAENDAYAALRSMAMQQNLALAEVARRVIAVASLLA